LDVEVDPWVNGMMGKVPYRLPLNAFKNQQSVFAPTQKCIHAPQVAKLQNLQMKSCE
jgi:hypothetical protein